MASPHLSRVTWRKSSYSSGANNCVEVAMAPSLARVRDSKNADGPQLRTAAPAWTGFIAAVKADQLGRANPMGHHFRCLIGAPSQGNDL